MKNIKIVEILETDYLSDDELFEAFVNGLIDGDFTVDELRELVEYNDFDIKLVIEEVIKESEYIADIKSSIKDDFDAIYKDGMGSSHYHNDEGGEK